MSKRKGDGGVRGTAAVGTRGLTPAQRTAIERLASGENPAATASAVGVGRATVYRWLRSDPAFAAAYNAWQAEVAETARGRLLALTHAAVTTVATALAKGDARTALTILRGQGLLAPREPGPTDPDLIARQARHRRAQDNMTLSAAEAQVPNEIFAPEVHDPALLHPHLLDGPIADDDPLPPPTALARRMPGPII